MNKPIKPRNLVLGVIFAISAIFALAFLFAPEFFTKPAPVAQKTNSASSVAIAIPTPTQVAPIEIEYRIQKYDTLTKIAQITCSTVSAIAKRNNIHNPDKIYVGKSLTLFRVEPCSPESVKSKTFPEKFANRTHDGASQGKLFTQPETGASRAINKHKLRKKAVAQKSVRAQTEIPATVASKEGCKNVGLLLRDFVARTLAIAECIKQNYAAIIKEGIETIDERVSPLEVIARMIVESKGDPFALNKQSNCKGLMQLQPGTAADYGVNLEKIYDPRENIFGGIRVIADYTYRLSKGDQDRGRVAYNAGPYSKLLRKKNFDPARFTYVREVRNVLTVLETHQFSL